jgi:hypothetical protein
VGDFNKVVTTWSGFPGAPGFTTMYFDGASTPPLAALQTFWSTIKNIFPTTVSLQVANSGVSINLGTGKPDGTWSGTAQTPVVGTGANAYAAPAGAEVEWKTGQFSNGREIRGKTFLVPIIIATYQTDGTIADTNRDAITTAATTLMAATPKIGVWSRGKHQWQTATSARCLDKVVVLRSRRP